MANFYESEDVKKVADELISAHKKDLSVCHIRYYLTDVISYKNQKAVLGLVRKISGFTKEGFQCDFAMIIPTAVWDSFNPVQRKALVHHELCHIGPKLKKQKDGSFQQQQDKEGNLTWQTNGHDLEEFSEIINTYGPWQEDIKEFMNETEAAPKVMPLGVINGKSKKAKLIDSNKMDEEFDKVAQA